MRLPWGGARGAGGALQAAGRRASAALAAGRSSGQSRGSSLQARMQECAVCGGRVQAGGVEAREARRSAPVPRALGAPGLAAVRGRAVRHAVVTIRVAGAAGAAGAAAAVGRRRARRAGGVPRRGGEPVRARAGPRARGGAPPAAALAAVIARRAAIAGGRDGGGGVAAGAGERSGRGGNRGRHVAGRDAAAVRLAGHVHGHVLRGGGGDVADDAVVRRRARRARARHLHAPLVLAPAVVRLRARGAVSLRGALAAPVQLARSAARPNARLLPDPVPACVLRRGGQLLTQTAQAQGRPPAPAPATGASPPPLGPTPASPPA